MWHWDYNVWTLLWSMHKLENRFINFNLKIAQLLARKFQVFAHLLWEKLQRFFICTKANLMKWLRKCSGSTVGGIRRSVDSRQRMDSVCNKRASFDPFQKLRVSYGKNHAQTIPWNDFEVCCEKRFPQPMTLRSIGLRLGFSLKTYWREQETTDPPFSVHWVALLVSPSILAGGSSLIRFPCNRWCSNFERNSFRGGAICWKNTISKANMV